MFNIKVKSENFPKYYNSGGMLGNRSSIQYLPYGNIDKIFVSFCLLRSLFGRILTYKLQSYVFLKYDYDYDILG